MNEFDHIASFYDAMYSERKHDVEFYVDLAKEIRGPVLECGCGTGRVLLPIAQSGIEIWGIDGSQAMLDVTRTKLRHLSPEIQNRIHVSHQDMCDFQLGQSFSLCIVPFRAFLHLLSIEDQEKALLQMHKHLKRGGILVLDIFAPSYKLLAEESATIHLAERFNPETGQNFTIVDHVRYEHDRQLIYVERYYEEVDDSGHVIRKVMHFSLRYIFRYEMQILLEKDGFRLKEVFGQFDKRPYDYTSGEMIFVAEKT
ncbi:MAG: class I SAM-dependent methyltransferase [bacterium]